MAIRDVKQYYMNLLAQYTELKCDLADFEQALKDGHITEDQLAAAVEDVAHVKNNLDRLSYVMYLFELPANKKSKQKYLHINNNIADYFKAAKADEDSVVEENTSVITHLRAELEKLKVGK